MIPHRSGCDSGRAGRGKSHSPGSTLDRRTWPRPNRPHTAARSWADLVAEPGNSPKRPPLPLSRSYEPPVSKMRSQATRSSR
jgi:hypothetical protein